MSDHGLPGEGVGRTLTAEQALAWFGEPRYSITDLQRAWAEGAAAALSSPETTPAGVLALDTERLAAAIEWASGQFIAAGNYRQAAEVIAAKYAALSSPETTPAPDAGPPTDPLCSSCAHPLHADFCPQWVPVQVVSCACAARLAALPQPGEPTK